MTSGAPAPAASLEQIRSELLRLRVEADSIGQSLLGFMLDQAIVHAETQLEAMSGADPSPPAPGRHPDRSTS